MSASQPRTNQPGPFQCTHCHEKPFDRISDFYVHLAICQPKVTVSYPNAEVQQSRDVRGRIPCYCSSSTCHRFYYSETELVLHIDGDDAEYVGPAPEQTEASVAATAGSGAPEANPVVEDNVTVFSTPSHDLSFTFSDEGVDFKAPTVNVYIGDPLATHPVLTSVGLYHNVDWNIIICASCGIGLTRNTALPHVRRNHPVFQSNINRDRFATVCDDLEIVDQLPDVFLVIEPISGLPLHRHALLCPFATCKKVYGTRGSMDFHHRKEHKECPKPAHYNTVCAQRFDNQKSRSYFQVKEPDQTIIPTALLNAEWLTAKEEFITQAIQEDTHNYQDVRALTDFLRITKWPDHTRPYKPANLRDLVREPANNELAWLKPAVLYKLRSDVLLIELTPLLILQRLNTADPAKGGISNEPFHAHQQPATLDKYMKEVYRLLAFLLRNRGDYQMPLSTTVMEDIHKLRVAGGHPASTPASLSPLIQNLLMSLWSNLWIPQPGNTVGDPTMCFIILSSIKSDLTFLQPKDITPLLARLTYNIRLVILRQIHSSPAGQTLVQSMEALQFMCTEKIDTTTFNSIMSLQHLATSIAMRTISLPSSFWSNNQYTEVVYRGSRVSMQDFCNMAPDMIKETFQFIHENLFLGKDLYIEYDHIADDLWERSPGYNIFQDHRNSSLKGKTRPLLQAIVEDASLRSRFLHGTQPETGEPIWNLFQLRLWYRQYCEAMKLLAVCCQIGGGSPARGTELTCIQFTNTPHQARGFFKVGTHWVLSCQYNKTSAITNQDKFVPHGLDAFTGDMIFQVRAIATPLAQLFASILYPGNMELQKLLNVFLFPDHHEILHSDSLSKEMRIRTLRSLGVELGIADYRQLSVAIRHKKCPELEILNNLDHVDTVGALQAGHSRQTEDRIYGITHESFNGHSEDMISLFLQSSDRWDYFMNIPSGAFQLCCRLLLSPSTSLPFISRVRSGCRDPQHDSDLAEPNSSTLPLVSLKGSPAPPITQPMFSQWPPKATEHQSLEELQSRCLKVLRDLLKDPNAQWTSEEQKNAVLAAASHCGDVVAILPTGGGKTMIPLISAMLTKSSLTVTKPVLLVTAEICHTRHFTQCLMEAHHRGILVQAFVFDEFHTVHTAAHYRESLQHIYALRSVPAKWILLSGTIPPNSLDSIMHKFDLHTNAIILRAATNRPELQYVVHPPLQTENSVMDTVVHAYALNKQQWKPEDRGLVYVPYTDLGWELAGRLQCDFYAGSTNMGDEERREKYQRWITGENDVMVCTHALGCGNDYPHVKWVCHAGTPYEMINYVQEVGRAGRNGEPALCEMVPKMRAEPALADGSFDHGGSLHMHSLVFERNRCIRLAITEFTDRVGMMCKDSVQNQPCSYCKPFLPSSQSPTLSQPGPLATHTVGSQVSTLPGSSFSLSQPPMIHTVGSQVSTLPGSSPTLSQPPVRQAVGSLVSTLPGSSPTLSQPPVNHAVSSQVSTLRGSSPTPSTSQASVGSSVFPSGIIPAPVFTTASKLLSKRPLRDSPPQADVSQVSTLSYGSNPFVVQAANSKKRKIEDTVQQTQYNKRIQDALTLIRDQCTCCLVKGRDASGHMANNCPGLGFSDMRAWRQSHPVRFTRQLHGHTCFRCHMPQNEGSCHPFTSSAQECPFPDLVLPLLWTIYQSPHHRQALQTFYEMHISTPITYTTWLSARPVPGHLNNSMATLLWFVEQEL